MPDWKTRLAVSYTVEGGGGPVVIAPIDSFSPSFSLNAEAIHSLEATHIGVVYSPQAISFSMTVKAIGPAAGQLTALALNGSRFNIMLQQQDGTGDDWSFHSVLLSDCIITSATPTSATISGAPSATFSGFSLQSTVEPKQGGEAKAGRK